jgi:hypothetical protein
VIPEIPIQQKTARQSTKSASLGGLYCSLGFLALLLSLMG